MRVVIQRVKKSSVKVDNKLINEIDNGFCILVGFTYDDTIDDIKYMVNKIINLSRIYSCFFCMKIEIINILIVVII